MSRLSLFNSLGKLLKPRGGSNTPGTRSTPLTLEVLEQRTLLSAEVIDPSLAPELTENADPLSIPLDSIFDDTEIEGTVLEFDTVLGSYFAELYDSMTPITVSNFLDYVADNDYANSFIHRLSRGFVIQGGTFLLPQPFNTIDKHETVVFNEFANYAIASGNDASVAAGGDVVQLPAGTDLSQIDAGQRIRMIDLNEGIELPGGFVTDFYLITDVDDASDTVTVAVNQITLEPASFTQNVQNLEWFITRDVNVRGTLSPPKGDMAPDSASSGFFVNLNNNAANLDIQNEGFAAFGEVVYDGMDLVDFIASLPTMSVGGLPTVPVFNFEGSMFFVQVFGIDVVNELSFEIVSNSNDAVAGISISNGSLVVDPLSPGSTDVTLSATDVGGNTAELIFTVNVTALGDLNGDGTVNAIDIDLLRDAINNGTSGAKYDIDGIGGEVPDVNDFNSMITDVLGSGFGDGDLNRVVNFDDFVLITNNFNQSPTGWAQGNFNLDDETNFDDFVIVTNNFGSDFNSPAASLAAEPSVSQFDVSLRRVSVSSGPVSAASSGNGVGSTITTPDSNGDLDGDPSNEPSDDALQDALHDSGPANFDDADVLQSNLSVDTSAANANLNVPTNDRSVPVTTSVDWQSDLSLDELLLPSSQRSEIRS